MAVAERPPDLRALLLDVTEAEVARAGVPAATMRGIARQAGVSHQAPGHHFGDRAGLLGELAVRAYAELAERLRAARECAGSDDAAPSAPLEAVGRAYVAFAVDRPGLFAVLCAPDAWDPQAPEARAAREGAWTQLGRAVDDARAGGWGRGQERDGLVVLCFSMVHGVAVLARDGLLTSELGGLDPAAAAEMVTRTLGAGLTGAP